MFPTLFTIGSITINTLPFSVGFSILTGAFLFWKSAKNKGFPEERVLDLILVLLISSLFFGRLTSIYLNRDLDLNLGSLIFGKVSALGVLIGAGLSGTLFLKRHNWSIYTIGDIAVIPAISAHFIGSLGKWLALSEPRILVESLFFLVLIVVIYRLQKKKIFPGFFLFLYLLSFSMVRIFGALITKDFRKTYFATYGLLIILCMLGLGRQYKKVKIKLLILGLKDLIPMISKETIEKAKNILTKKKEKIVQEKLLLESQDPYMQPGRAEHNAELEDDAQEDREHDEISAQKEALEDSRKQVDVALTKIKKGTYGVCESCGKEIDPARLKAIPEATMCLNCESKG